MHPLKPFFFDVASPQHSVCDCYEHCVRNVQRYGHLDKMPFIMKLRAWAQVTLCFAMPPLLMHIDTL